MSYRNVVVTTGLLLAYVIVSHVSSNENVDGKSSAALKDLEQKVDKLRKEVDFLMVEHRHDGESLEAHAAQVRHAELFQKHVDTLYASGGGAESQLHNANRHLHIAQARQAIAANQYDECLKHFDAAVAAAKRHSEIMRNRLGTGTATLEFVIAAQQTVTDLQLQRNHARRRIELLQGLLGEAPAEPRGQGT